MSSKPAWCSEWVTVQPGHRNIISKQISKQTKTQNQTKANPTKTLSLRPFLPQLNYLYHRHNLSSSRLPTTLTCLYVWLSAWVTIPLSSLSESCCRFLVFTFLRVLLFSVDSFHICVEWNDSWFLLCLNMYFFLPYFVDSWTTIEFWSKVHFPNSLENKLHDLLQLSKLHGC